MTVISSGLADADQIELSLPTQVLERPELLGQEIAGRFAIHQTEVDEVHSLHLQRP